MECRKLNLVYFSATYTTKRVLKEIAAQWKGDVQEYDVTLDLPAEDIQIGSDELLVMGVPVYAGRIPTVALPALQKFKGKQTPAMLVAVYGNREYDDALLELKDLVEANCFKPIAAGAFIAQHSIFPAVGSQRPDPADQELIRRFARNSFSLLEKVTQPETLPDLLVKGNRPYKIPGKIPLKPRADKTCTECGACVRLCPVDAIPMKNPRKTNEKICISCGRCVLICPQGARRFGGLIYKLAHRKFVAAYTERKEPELFFSDSVSD